METNHSQREKTNAELVAAAKQALELWNSGAFYDALMSDDFETQLLACDKIFDAFDAIEAAINGQPDISTMVEHNLVEDIE